MAHALHLPNLDWDVVTTDYLHLVNTIVPGPQSWSYFIPQVLLPTSLLVPPRILSHHALATLVFPIILASTTHAVIAMRGPDVISMDTLWWSLYFLVLQDPRIDFKRVLYQDERDMKPTNDRDVQDSIHSSGPPQTDSKLVDWPYPSTIMLRLKWTLTLLSERPFSCWKINRRSHDTRVSPPYISQTRSKFVKDIFIILLPAIFLLMPLALQLHTVEENHHETYSGASNWKDYFAASLSWTLSPQSSIIHTLSNLLPAWITESLMMGLFLYSFLITLFLPGYLVPPLISFLINPSFGAAHTWSPHLWPRPHFGPFTAVLDSGLRGLWGTWWHQQMRHAVSEPGRWLSDFVGLKSGLVRYGIICMSAFTLSGITHMGLVPPDVTNAWELRFMIGAFFFMQPIGILAEVVVIERVLSYLETTLSATRLRTAIIQSLRLCWVLLFMSFPLRLLVMPFEDLGYWSIWPPSCFGESVSSVLRGDWMS
jgi:hypothetical protein